MGKIKYGKPLKFSKTTGAGQPSRQKADAFGKAAKKRVDAFAKRVKI